MIQLRRSGKYYHIIGEQFNVSKSYVYRILQGKRLADKFEQALLATGAQ